MLKFQYLHIVDIRNLIPRRQRFLIITFRTGYFIIRMILHFFITKKMVQLILNHLSLYNIYYTIIQNASLFHQLSHEPLQANLVQPLIIIFTCNFNPRSKELHGIGCDSIYIHPEIQVVPSRSPSVSDNTYSISCVYILADYYINRRSVRISRQ